ncbi:MAG TPA: polysaccharide pyruvyl transferase family protein, partial [Candidatus Limnocylindria bacterium]
ILDGEPPDRAAVVDPMPNHLSHPLLQHGRVRLFVEPWPWIKHLGDYDFAFGSRIHGNIVAILAGTPSYLLAHDCRTLELARYHQIPHRPLTEIDADTDPADLYAEADYGPLIAGHADRFARFTAFMAQHGLRHVFAEGEDPSAFDRRVAMTRYPDAVTTPGLAGNTMRWLQATGDAASAKARRVPGGLRRRARRILGGAGSAEGK